MGTTEFCFLVSAILQNHVHELLAHARVLAPFGPDNFDSQRSLWIVLDIAHELGTLGVMFRAGLRKSRERTIEQVRQECIRRLLFTRQLPSDTSFKESEGIFFVIALTSEGG
jgi:uncharacterized membrane protein